MSMRSLGLTVAALAVLVSNGLGIWQSSRNRAEPSGGTLQLTERELPLQRVELESSVTVLLLKWKTARRGNDRWGSAPWLTLEKLGALGFDCSVPADGPGARWHYGAMPARRVFLVLEYQPPHADVPNPVANRHCGLTVLDAGVEPQKLRNLYPDRERFAITRGLVRIAWRGHDSDGQPLERPELVGWVQGLIPSLISAPQPVNELLRGLQKEHPDADAADDSRAPRYTARVRWGRNYEPWVDEIEALNSP